MKHIIAITTAAFLLIGVALNCHAQNILGTAVVINGQTFLVTTNGSGNLIVSALTTNGNEIIQVPATPDEAMQAVTGIVGKNNPSNIGYYGSNELTASVFAGYLQNSGQAVAGVSIQKYGTFGWNNVGFGAGILQGNNAGKSGTAGAFAEATYRKPIGDVAFEGGPVVGWDNWSKKVFGGADAGVEYRQNAHLGEFVKVAYAYESGQSDRGEIIFGGVTYAF